MPGIVTVSDQDSVTICLGYRHYLTFIKLYSVVFLVNPLVFETSASTDSAIWAHT